MVATTLIQHTMVFAEFIEHRRSTNLRAYHYLLEQRDRWDRAVKRNRRIRFIEIMPRFRRASRRCSGRINACLHPLAAS